jgi:hypothetical protein
MGRPKGSGKGKDEPAEAARPPMMKFGQAQRLADKNSRTMMKVSQLLEITHLPGYSESDPGDLVGKYVEKLRTRVAKRLQKLARWADSSADERHAEFRNTPSVTNNYPYRTFVKPMLYSKPVPASFITATLAGRNAKIPWHYLTDQKPPASPAPQAPTAPTITGPPASMGIKFAVPLSSSKEAEGEFIVLPAAGSAEAAEAEAAASAESTESAPLAVTVAAFAAETVTPVAPVESSGGAGEQKDTGEMEE